MNKAYFRIQGKEYAVRTEDDPAYVTSLGARLDGDVSAIMADNSRASLTDALVLCALKYLDDRQKNNASADNLRRQVTEYLEEANRARIALEEARKEIDRLKGAQR